MEDLSPYVWIPGEVADRVAHEVHGGHLHAPAVDLGRGSQTERFGDEGALEVSGVGRSAVAVAGDVSRAVHGDRQPALRGLPHQLLGDPLGLAVAVLSGLCQRV